MEVKDLPSLTYDDLPALQLLTFIHKKQELHPSLWAALRIACALPAIVDELLKAKAHGNLPIFLINTQSVGFLPVACFAHEVHGIFIDHLKG